MHERNEIIVKLQSHLNCEKNEEQTHLDKKKKEKDEKSHINMVTTKKKNKKRNRKFSTMSESMNQIAR